MRTPATAEVEFTPLFDWTHPRRRKLSIMGFIAASVALHALCFYLFQVIYPPTVALLPPPARVTVITPDSDEGRLLLRWIEAEDPALLSTTQRPPDAATVPLPTAVHVPSYTNWTPALRIPATSPSIPPIPSAQPPGPVPVRRIAAAPKTVLAPTTLRFGMETETLGPATFAPLRFTASRADVPAAAEFRVAIEPTGAVRYSFLESSSGDSALDAQARTAIMATRFPASQVDTNDADSHLIWTTASVEWGNDISLPVPSSAASPTP